VIRQASACRYRHHRVAMCHGEYSRYVSRRLQAVCGNHGEATLRHIRSGPLLDTNHRNLQAAKPLL